MCFRGLDSDGLPPTVGAHCSELRRHLDTHFFDVAEGHQGGDVGKGSRVAIQPIQKEQGNVKEVLLLGDFNTRRAFSEDIHSSCNEWLPPPQDCVLFLLSIVPKGGVVYSHIHPTDQKFTNFITRGW